MIVITCVTALACLGGFLGAYGLGFTHGYLEGERRAGEPKKKPAVPITHVRGSHRAAVVLGMPWLTHDGRNAS